MTNNNADKNRDIWDKFGSISLFLSSVVIGAAGLWINSGFNERESQRAIEIQKEQQQIAKVQTLSNFMPHLSGNKEGREAALYAITVLGYPELAIRLNELRKEDQKTNDAIMRTAPASISIQLDTKVPVSITKDKYIGWVYLGDYSTLNNSWNTRYLNFGEKDKPDDLLGKAYIVRMETGAINIRAGMPTVLGEFMRVVMVLQPGDKLKLLEIKQWLTTGYTWARVASAD